MDRSGNRDIKYREYVEFVGVNELEYFKGVLAHREKGRRTPNKRIYIVGMDGDKGIGIPRRRETELGKQYV